MMRQPRAADEPDFGRSGPADRKSDDTSAVRPGMRWVLLLVLIALLVFLSNQLWLLFVGSPLF
jgi:hypothetical protein